MFFGNQIYDKSMNSVRAISKEKYAMIGNDPNNIAQLYIGTIVISASVIIFRPKSILIEIYICDGKMILWLIRILIVEVFLSGHSTISIQEFRKKMLWYVLVCIFKSMRDFLKRSDSVTGISSLLIILFVVLIPVRNGKKPYANDATRRQLSFFIIPLTGFLV